jgi:hypothetical protein
MGGRSAWTALAGSIAVAIPGAALAAPMGGTGIGFGGGLVLAGVISVLGYAFRTYLMMRGAMDLTRSLRGKRGLGGTIEPDGFEERVAAKLREMNGGEQPTAPASQPRPQTVEPAAQPQPVATPRPAGFGRRQARPATLSGKSLPNTR